MDVYEFFSPFAHVPGRLEWCRIRSPTHGVFDTFIVLGASTAEPADVYVRDDAGAAFMADRYPECRTHRVEPRSLQILEREGGRGLVGLLVASEGPVRSASMVFAAADGPPRVQEYGGEGRPVWGSQWSCWGVDLELDATVHGHVQWQDRTERFDDESAVVTLGSFGRIRPL